MKIDKKALEKTLLPLLGGVFTIGGMILSNKIDSNNRNEMKSELKSEIIEEIFKKND